MGNLPALGNGVFVDTGTCDRTELNCHTGQVILAEEQARYPWRGSNWLTLWTWSLLALGILWRVTRYLLQWPIGGDEPLLAMNLVECDFCHVFQPLKQFCQVAPPFFVLLEWVAFHHLGGSELAMRFIPLLAGLVSLLVFKRIAEKVLSPLAAALAVGLLAVSYLPVKMSSNVKPYSFDLLGTLALLWVIVEYRDEPRQSRWLWILVGVIPLVMLSSFPAAFVVPAIGLGMVGTVWQNRTSKILTAFAVFCLVSVGTFGLLYCFSIAHTPVDVMIGMRWCWAHAFPPGGVLPFMKWFLLMNTGEMFAYPVGSLSGGSTLTTLLFLTGLWRFAKEKRYFLVCISVVPFILGLAAAFLRRYPYGGAGRVYQHVVPFILLGAAAGLASLLRKWFADAGKQRKWSTAIFVGLTLLGIIGLARDFFITPHGAHDAWGRAVGEYLTLHVQPDDQVVLGRASERLDIVLDWYLLPLRNRTVRLDKVTDADLAGIKGDLWLLYCNYQQEDTHWTPTQELPAVRAFSQRLRTTDPDWSLADQVSYLTVEEMRNHLAYCLTYRWTKARLTPKQNLAAWPR